MARSSSTRSVAAFVVALVVALALVSVVAVLATGAFGRSVTPEPVPSEAPAPTPTAQPSVAPTPDPTAAPSPTPAGDLTFDLDVATPHDVSVVLEDESDIVTGAKSGRGGDGMSVRWGLSIVENIDDDTIRLTWVGLPQDDIVEMVVKEIDGRVVIAIDQRHRPPTPMRWATTAWSRSTSVAPSLRTMSA